MLGFAGRPPRPRVSVPALMLAALGWSRAAPPPAADRRSRVRRARLYPGPGSPSCRLTLGRRPRRRQRSGPGGGAGAAGLAETLRAAEQALRARGYDVDLSARWDGIFVQDGTMLVSRDELGWRANGVVSFTNSPQGGGRGPAEPRRRSRVPRESAGRRGPTRSFTSTSRARWRRWGSRGQRGRGGADPLHHHRGRPHGDVEQRWPKTGSPHGGRPQPIGHAPGPADGTPHRRAARSRGVQPCGWWHGGRPAPLPRERPSTVGAAPGLASGLASSYRSTARPTPTRGTSATKTRRSPATSSRGDDDGSTTTAARSGTSATTSTSRPIARRTSNEWSTPSWISSLRALPRPPVQARAPTAPPAPR